jgi:integrase
MLMGERPYLSSYKDRHGKERWRFRRGKDDRSIPGNPGEPRFEQAYDDALNGKPARAAVIRHPNQALPRTLKAAWRMATASDNMEWQRLGKTSRDKYIQRAERLLAMKVPPDTTYADVPVADLKRRHVKALLGTMSDTPHAAYDALVVLRKMILVALDQEWIEIDPTHRLKYRPESDGHRAWTDDERAKYEATWPLGTLARTAYACVLYSGPRRSDVARFKWTDFEGETFPHTQQKTGRRLVLTILPALREALDAAPRLGEHVLTTPWGTPRALGTLTNDFARWTKAAGLKGCTMHGLRKTLGKILAEEGATTRELMDTLGHTSIAHAELYSREADQARMAKAALGKASKRLRPRLKVVGGEPADEPMSSLEPKRLK